MKKYLIFYPVPLFILCHASIYAASGEKSAIGVSWQELSATEQSVVFIKDIRKMSHRYLFWAKQTNAPDATCLERKQKFLSDPTEDYKCETKAEYEPATIIMEYEMDCKSRLIRQRQGISYNQYGKIINSSGPKPKPWSSIIPDTIGERFFNFLCR